MHGEAVSAVRLWEGLLSTVIVFRSDPRADASVDGCNFRVGRRPGAIAITSHKPTFQAESRTPRPTNGPRFFHVALIFYSLACGALRFAVG